MLDHCAISRYMFGILLPEHLTVDAAREVHGNVSAL